MVVVVGQVFLEDPTQMSFVQYDDLIKTLATDWTDDAFRVSVLPRRCRRERGEVTGSTSGTRSSMALVGC